VADPFANTGYPLVLGSAVTTLEGIDMRNRQNLRYYESGYPFEYYMVRFLYHGKREIETGRYKPEQDK
jgi:phospholipid-binding lipoprotein MlaA